MDTAIYAATGVKLPTTAELLPDWGRASQPSPRSNPDTIASYEGPNYYRDTALSDPTVKAALDHRDVSFLWVSARGLLRDPGQDVANPYEIDDADWLSRPQLWPGANTPEALTHWNFVAAQFDSWITRGMPQVLHNLQYNAMVVGLGVGELILTRRETRWTNVPSIIITDIRDKDAALFTINPGGRPPGLYHQTRKLDQDKFVMYRNQAALDNPYGVSELRSVVNVLFSKNQFLRFLERHLERWGSGQFFLQYPEEKSGKFFADYQSTLLTQARQLRNQGFGVLPKGVVMQVLESAGAGTLFIDALNYLDDLVVIAFTGNNMSIKSPSVGSYALSDNTTAVAKSEYELSDASGLSAALSDLARRVVLWNFAGAETFPYVQLIHPSKYLPAQDSKRIEQEAIQVSQTDAKSENPKPAKDTDDLVEQLAMILHDSETDSQDDLPEFLLDPVIQQGAADFLANQQVALRDDFDKLPPEQQRRTYTIKGVPSLATMRALQGAVVNTLSQGEGPAWKAYALETLPVWDGRRASIPLAFRHARINAYMAGIETLVSSDPSYTHYEYVTRDDSNVRLNHALMHGITRPVNDPIWLLWRSPNGFGCRCLFRPRRGAISTPDDQMPDTLPDRKFYDPEEVATT